MLSAADVTGLLALPPSPLRTDGEHLTEADSLDLDEATRLADQMIEDGVAAIGLCGTTGECATLLWDEKVALYDDLRETGPAPAPLCKKHSHRESFRRVLRLSNQGLLRGF